MTEESGDAAVSVNNDKTKRRRGSSNLKDSGIDREPGCWKPVLSP
jgi:hypothetical protein